ncbi:hypothetical protein ALO43_200338 [Pseudomonas tremae]|uniref:Uncharacterized protein n=1 Tax=Pseudomonas tremae TaxID=200454 RepID=A0AA40P3Q9_9PSED|nr:hypothetical protein ALO43_200338 [Pseudomonas tremae]
MAQAQRERAVFAQVGFQNAVQQRRSLFQAVDVVSTVFVRRDKTPAHAARVVELAAAIQIDPVLVPTAGAGGDRELR